MHGRRGDTEVALQLRFRRRVAVNLGLVIDERQVFALLFRVTLLHGIDRKLNASLDQRCPGYTSPSDDRFLESAC